MRHAGRIRRIEFWKLAGDAHVFLREPGRHIAVLFQPIQPTPVFYLSPGLEQ
jgi:hypothetical protein